MRNPKAALLYVSHQMIYPFEALAYRTVTSAAVMLVDAY